MTPRSTSQLWRAVLLAIALTAGAPARAETTEPRRTERAYAGVHLKSVRHLSANDGLFEADLLLWVRWRTANAIDPGEVTVDNAMELFEREELSHEQQGAWTQRLWRIRGVFYGHFELRNFPFDPQMLRLTIAHPSLPSSVLRLEPDIERSGVAAGLEIPGWIFERSYAVFQGRELPAAASRDAGRGRSSVEFQLALRRPLLSLLTKILLPLFVCLAMGHAAFWLDPNDTSSRLIMVSMAVFAAVCVHFTLGETVPDAGYLVIADYYVFLVYALLFGYIVGAVASQTLMLRQRAVAVHRLDRAIRWGFPVLLTIAAIYVSIPEEPQPAAPPARRVSAVARLVVGTTQEPQRLGLGAEGGIERFFTGLFLRPLARLDDRWQLQPELATVVPSFGNGQWELRPNGSAAVRWVLRPDLQWGDGRPIVPQDFVATHEAQPYRGVTRVRATEDGAIFEYDQPRPDAVYDVALYPAHQLQGLDEEARRERLQKSPPPLSGPFLLESWAPGEGLVLRRNPHYALGRASLEEIQVRFFPKKEALLDAARRGEVHLIPQGDLKPEEAEALARELPSMAAQIADSTVLWHLEANLEDPILADVRVRRALLLGTDREAMIRLVAQGQGEVAHSWLPVQHEGYDPAIRRYAYDPEQAGALLDEAGWRLGEDGLRRNAEGRPLRLSVAAIPTRRAEVEVLKMAWGPLGIEVSFEEVPHDRFLGEYTARRQFPQLAFYGFVASPHDTGRKRWDQDRIPTEQNGWTGENLTGWRHRQVSEIHRRLETTWSSEARTELLAAQQAIWAEELPILPLYTAKSAILHDVRLRNLRPHPSERAYLSWNAEDWYFEP